MKVVGSENCARKDKLPLWGLGVKPLVAWQFLQFSEKIAILMTFRTFLEQLEKAKLRRFGRV